jgi:hypothetical protein
MHYQQTHVSPKTPVAPTYTTCTGETAHFPPLLVASPATRRGWPRF